MEQDGADKGRPFWRCAPAYDGPVARQPCAFFRWAAEPAPTGREGKEGAAGGGDLEEAEALSAAERTSKEKYAVIEQMLDEARRGVTAIKHKRPTRVNIMPVTTFAKHSRT